MVRLIRVIGWLAVAAGAGVAIVCVALLLGRSSADNEGMIMGAALGTLVLISLPTFLVGTLILGFANGTKAKSGAV